MHLQFIQNLIYKLEMGGGMRYLRMAALTLAIVMLGVRYDAHAYRNMANPEGMDAAQLARNIADGKGYTTLVVRPFSLYLMQQHNQGGTLANTNSGAVLFKNPLPDLSNAPLYPYLLAGTMKVLTFDYTTNLDRPFWNENGKFQRFEPDFKIATCNQVLLLAVVILVFFLARKLFDVAVAWISAALVIGCDEFWKFSVSGLPTMLLMVIFLGLAWCLLKIEELARAPKPRFNKVLALAIAAGVVTGAGALTRYAFGWTIIPVAVYLILFGGQQKLIHVLAALGAFVVVLTPWLIRNYAISGTLFGTAGYSVLEGPYLYPQFQLERSLSPDVTHVSWVFACWNKLEENMRGIIVDLPKLGGSWACVLFLAGLLLRFRNAAATRMRYFLLMCLGVLIVVQALGQTEQAADSPEINSENLLVLLAPLVFIYGVGFFFTMLDQLELPLLQLRYIVITGVVGLCCLPMIFTLLPPRINPVVYPPYYPPDIQRVCGWMDKNELMMSDVPWAVAWYGQRQCVWLTMDWRDDFMAINRMKPIQALYLTPQTTDGKFVSEWMEGNENGWGKFLYQTITDGRVPDEFPLRYAPTGYLPERAFLADRKRW